MHHLRACAASRVPGPHVARPELLKVQVLTTTVSLLRAAAGHGGAGGAPEDDRTVVFVSNDNEEFEVPMAVVRMSEFAMMQAGGEEDDDDDDGDKTRVYLPNVKGRVLARIVEWCKLHVDDPFPEVSRPIPRPNMRDAGVSEADEEWVNAVRCCTGTCRVGIAG